MRYITRPLTDEARARLKGVRREGSPFSGSWTATLQLLDRELWYLGVRNEFVLQIDCQESELRLDGELRANARPASPSVAISIEAKGGALLFVCGKFPQWQHNVRAIALGLEALRKVQRYGIVQSDEQYRGWKAIGSGIAMPQSQMTVEDAAALLRDQADRGYTANGIIGNPDVARAAYRDAAKKHHPDTGGDEAVFKRLVEARDLLVAS